MSRGKQAKNRWIHENRLLCKLILAHNDIMLAYRACREWLKIGDDLGHNQHAPLFTTLVISYGRAFGSNRPFGELPSRWSRFEDRSRQALHKTLLDLRNEEYAHSDASRERVMIIPPGCQLDGRVFPRFGFACSTTVLPVIEGELVERHLRALAEKMAAEIVLMIARLYAEKEIPDRPFGPDTHGRGNSIVENIK